MVCNEIVAEAVTLRQNFPFSIQKLWDQNDDSGLMCSPTRPSSSLCLEPSTRQIVRRALYPSSMCNMHYHQIAFSQDKKNRRIN